MMVAMVDVRVVRVAVHQACVPVRVHVGLGAVPGGIVFVPVVLVVPV